MPASAASPAAAPAAGNRDVGFAIAVTVILCALFVPVPAAFIDAGLALSIALSVVILMLALWIQKPLEFSAFPTVLLIATLLRLSLNIATTRLILSHGHEGEHAAGHIIGGFASLVMSGDFAIGVIVFTILITVNFVVITKGATRIAEVGARFTLDAIPGKQMAIDADLSAGLVDEQEARRRRHELEEESAFFGAMDGASKFVRGDAVAGLIITAVNVFGGIVIGIARHDMALADAADVFTRLSVGDGLVTQIPALIVSLAAGLLVSKGGTRGSAETAVLGQLAGYPRALAVAGGVMLVLGLSPGLPLLPFAVLGTGLVAAGRLIPRRRLAESERRQRIEKLEEEQREVEERTSLRHQLKVAEIELALGKHLAGQLTGPASELAQRVARMRRKFARDYGFVVPEIRVSDDLALAPAAYAIRIHGTQAAAGELRIGEQMIILGPGRSSDLPGEEVSEPAFGMRAMWLPEALAREARRDGFEPVDPLSVLLTHLSETIRAHLAQLLSYRDMQALLDALEPAYRKLIEEVSPAHVSQSGLLAVLRQLLAERVSIRNLPLILEAVAEIAPHVRRPEQIAELVRARLAAQISGDVAAGGPLRLLRLGARWDLTFHQALKRDARGEVVQFDIEPRQVEQFGAELAQAVAALHGAGRPFALVTGPEARPYVRMITERLHPALPVLSHVEIARGVTVETVATVS